MNNYEISLWEDKYNSSNDRYDEQKIAVIGSNTMTSQARAIEPKLVTNIDGTSTLTFDMYYYFMDSITGEEVYNPYIKYLVNERKVKALWKNKWYDFLIKDIKEDSSGRVFSYTCEDAYITELSRTGFSLEFETELENNIGTAPDLVEKVLEGTDWRFNPNDTIYQSIQESVFETTTQASFSAIQEPEDQSYSIPNGAKILVFFSNVSDQENLPSTFTFYYANNEDWYRDGSNMEVTNGQSYHVGSVVWTVSDNIAIVKKNGTTLASFNINLLSDEYIASHYVNTQKQVYSNILERYVNVYSVNGTPYYGYQTTVFESPLSVVNLVTNPTEFKNLSGWLGTDLTYDIYPAFNSSTEITTYDPHSYITVSHTSSKNTYIGNTGVVDNKSYFPDGFTKGEKYIFRLQITSGANYTNIDTPSLFVPSIATRDITSDTLSPGTNYFILDGSGSYTNNYLEYTLKCVKSCSVEEIKGTNLRNLTIFLKMESTSSVTYHIKEMQFFKEVYGTQDGVRKRINPGELDLQSVSESVWRYYLASKEGSNLTADTLEYDHISSEEWSSAIPVYNAYAKAATIKASKSNRFNILQDIAEKFKCWVRFEIDHNTDGSIKRDSEGLRKFITLYQDIGTETSINFNYGVDLKGITRTLKSTNIATKTIVPSNENSLGENGFCSIARSPWNYSGENFIYNFDYYVSQGLLDYEQLNYDLYNTNNGYLFKLHGLNQNYRQNEIVLAKKKLELIRQEATYEIYSQYKTSAEAQLANVKDQAFKLSNTSTMSGVNSYLKSHANNTRVKALVNDYTQTNKTINKYAGLLNKIQSSINVLNNSINTLETAQASIITQLNTLHKSFYEKYSRFIQEGVWNSEDYWDDTKYYLDAVNVAFESSRPKIEYDISVVRLSDIDEYSSKVFDLGDICTVQDVRYFGYEPDGITPYKEKVFISEVTSYFDTPSKDSFKVQNYKNQFDDLFQRITATTQSLSFSEGKYAKISDIIGTDGTIKYSVLQATFDSNRNLVMGSLNESVQIDNRGITVLSNDSDAGQVRITSGGLFVTNDGGATWKNAVRGDGISADVLVAGSINTEQINIYGKDAPSFVWNDKGIHAYLVNNGVTDLNKYVRFDKYGIYGVTGKTAEFNPTSETDVYNNASFGMTWNRFFMKKAVSGKGSVEISSDDGFIVKNSSNQTVFSANENGVTIGAISGDTWDAITNAQSTATTANNTANNNKTTLAGITTVSNNVTYIDGGKIYTGSITANAIAANAITANKIKLYGEMTVYTGNNTTSGGSLGYMAGSDGEDTTHGIALKSSDGTSQIITTTAGVRMTRIYNGTAHSAYIASTAFVLNSGTSLIVNGGGSRLTGNVTLNYTGSAYSGTTYCNQLYVRYKASSDTSAITTAKLQNSSLGGALYLYNREEGGLVTLGASSSGGTLWLYDTSGSYSSINRAWIVNVNAAIAAPTALSFTTVNMTAQHYAAFQFKNMVMVSVNAVATQTIADGNTTIIKGLPKASATTTAVCYVLSNSTRYLCRVQIASGGTTIQLYYAHVAVAANAEIAFQIIYPTS